MRIWITGVVLAASPLLSFAEWADACPEAPYCDQVGKTAYNAQGAEALRKIPLGTITGVAWRPEGSLIGISPAAPSAGIPEQARLSPRDAWYYIIGPGGVSDTSFIRQVREITPRKLEGS